MKTYYSKLFKKSALVTLSLSITIGLIGCDQKSTKKNISATSTNPLTNPNPVVTPYPTGTSTPAPTSCAYCSGTEPGVADSGQTINYYKLNSPYIIAHGANQGNIVFSTESNLPANYNQNIFFSDSRFNVRVIPRYQNKGTDSMGVPCAYNPQPFTKMNIGIVLRSRQSSPGVGDYHRFSDVQVDCPSKIHEFQVPSTSDPLVVEVMNVQWDWSCKSYEQQGYPNVPGVCPYDNVWQTECYALEVQFSTDTTKDIPGTKTYQ
jgi:hypothetical protein